MMRVMMQMMMQCLIVAMLLVELSYRIGGMSIAIENERLRLRLRLLLLRWRRRRLTRNHEIITLAANSIIITNVTTKLRSGSLVISRPERGGRRR